MYCELSLTKIGVATILIIMIIIYLDIKFALVHYERSNHHSETLLKQAQNSGVAEAVENWGSRSSSFASANPKIFYSLIFMKKGFSTLT